MLAFAAKRQADQAALRSGLVVLACQGKSRYANVLLFERRGDFINGEEARCLHCARHDRGRSLLSTQMQANDVLC